MTAATLTITEFLLARIAEDEAAARMAGNVQLWRDDQRRSWIESPHGRVDLPARPSFTEATLYDHLARHLPGRVMADCEAKRRIVEMHPVYRGPRLLAVDSTGNDFGCERCHATSSIDDQSVIEALGECDTLLALASVYADHPDYREEWKP